MKKKNRRPKLIVYKNFFPDALASYRPKDHSIHNPQLLATPDSPILKHELRHADSYLVWKEARIRKWWLTHLKALIIIVIAGFITTESASLFHLSFAFTVIGFATIFLPLIPLISIVSLDFLAEREAYWAETHSILEPSMVWHWRKRKR